MNTVYRVSLPDGKSCCFGDYMVAKAYAGGIYPIEEIELKDRNFSVIGSVITPATLADTDTIVKRIASALSGWKLKGKYQTLDAEPAILKAYSEVCAAITKEQGQL